MDEHAELACPTERPRSRDKIHLRVSSEWQAWQECCQMRRSRVDFFEFRRSAPICMALALGLLAAAIDTAFIGYVMPYRGIGLGGLVLIVAPPLFAFGRGTIIDGAARRVSRWWGFVPRPLLTSRSEFGAYRAVEITRTYSFSRGQGGGRWVRHPVRLVKQDGRPVVLFRGTWHEDALELATALAGLLGIPLEDRAEETPHPG